MVRLNNSLHQTQDLSSPKKSEISEASDIHILSIPEERFVIKFLGWE
jgi:hypothetical protein